MTSITKHTQLPFRLHNHQVLNQAMMSSNYLIVNTTRFVEIKYMFSRIVNKIQQLLVCIATTSHSNNLS